MNKIKLIAPSEQYAKQIEEYKEEFSKERNRVTVDINRISGMDYLENFDRVIDWLAFCKTMSHQLTWYMAIRPQDEKIIGFIVFRHKLEYDDDDLEFASHFGYSIRPSERLKGYAKEQLRLGLEKAKEYGLDKVRIICRDTNIGSNKTIVANGGIYIDCVYGEETGMTACRYDIDLS